MTFIKGHSYNKGRRFTKEHREKLRRAKLGRKLSEEHKRKIGESTRKWISQREHHPNYQGDNVGINRIHRRIEAKLGKPKYCEICKKTDRKRYEWANKDHKYKLTIKDWQRLCVSCHIKFDRKFNGREQGIENFNCK